MEPWKRKEKAEAWAIRKSKKSQLWLDIKVTQGASYALPAAPIPPQRLFLLLQSWIFFFFLIYFLKPPRCTQDCEVLTHATGLNSTILFLLAYVGDNLSLETFSPVSFLAKTCSHLSKWRCGLPNFKVPVYQLLSKPWYKPGQGQWRFGRCLAGRFISIPFPLWSAGPVFQ